MLETEPQNLQSEPDESRGEGQDASQEGGQRRGLLRRGRRSVTKPAAPLAFKSGASAEDPEGGTPQDESGQRTQSPAVPAVPSVPVNQPADAAERGRGGVQQPVPAAAFQPPVLVFQPPELTQRPAAEPASRQDADAGGDGRGDGDGDGDSADGDGQGGGSRRRRRGGRGRGKGGAGEGGAGQPGETGAQGGGAGQGADGGAQGADRRGDSGQVRADKAAGDGQDADGDEADGEAGGSSSSRRRRRRRQRTGSVPSGGEVPSPDEPADTVVHIREPRSAESDDVRAVKGSTRLEAKRQRRREGRDTGRRRPPIISESEFLARREAVERVMVVRQRGDRTQIAVLEDNVLVEHYVDRASHQSYVGNVYLGKVQNVLPSMEAAFVDIGKGRNAVLYAGEVNFDASGLEGVAKRIESALKSGQSIMVQVTKDPIGHKGARLTSQVSLPGRYLVYVPGASMTGISRKLPDTERTRLKQILKKVAPEDGGIIVRTAAEGASEEELLHDVTRLVAQWQAIERKAKTASAPDLLYGEPDLTIRVVRDIFNEDFTKLVIASDSEWDLVDEYVRYVAPNLAERLERWPDESDLFAAYRIDEQLAKALDRKVWLPSGGSLVIDTTEAMTVIDVNTGKFTGQGGNLEQTVTRNNLEAAEEIVRQLRLRDIGGIIVIDFIDMVLESNRDLVLRRMIECLARDRTKHQVAEVTSLGLVQMTRKRVGSGLLVAFSVPCEHCNGRGLLVSTDLTDVAHSHGRNGQQGGSPKPGPSRSRSARTKAIAQVAAASTGEADDTEAAGAADAPDADAAPDTAAAPAAKSGRGGRAAGGRSARTAKSSGTAPNGAAPAAGAAGAGAAAGVADADVAAAQAPEPDGDGQASTASSRRRPRRSAHRAAGPPNSAAAPADASAAGAAQAGDGAPARVSSDAAPAGGGQAGDGVPARVSSDAASARGGQAGDATPAVRGSDAATAGDAPAGAASAGAPRAAGATSAAAPSDAAPAEGAPAGGAARSADLASGTPADGQSASTAAPEAAGQAAQDTEASAGEAAAS